MDGERTAGVLMFIAIAAFLTICVVSHLRPNLTMDGVSYVQVGVMKIEDNGNTLYTPVYKRNK